METKQNIFNLRYLFNYLNSNNIIDSSLIKDFNMKNSKKVKSNTIIFSKEQMNILKSFFTQYYIQNKKIYNDLLKDISNGDNGKINELFVYYWLHDNYIDFIPQCEISSHNCFKKTNYISDGIINKRIVFDIKSFGIVFYTNEILYNKLAKKIYDKLGKDYILSIDAPLVDNDQFNKYLNNTDDLVTKILSSKKNDILYIYRDGNSFTFTVRKCSHSCNISHIDTYEWAQKNEYYPIKHSSQFVVNNPYILFYAFDDSLYTYFQKQNDLYAALRTISRRFFISLNKKENIFINEFDTKASNNISVATASRKISAVVYINISKKHSYNNSEIYAFINPNADYKLFKYEINNLFEINGVTVDSFEFDNY